MSGAGWPGLVALRQRRADTALSASQQANRRRAEAAQARDAASSAFDLAESNRAARRQALYASAADRALTVKEILALTDRVHAIALESQSHRDHVLQLVETHRQAVHAADEAAAIHRDLRRAADKSESVQRRLTEARVRKEEIYLETDLEDLTVISRAFSKRSGNHAG